MTDWLLFLLTVIFGGIAGGMIGRGVYDRLTAYPPPTKEQLGFDPEVVDNWLSWNGWFLQDQALALEAQSIHVRRQRTHPGEPLETNLVEVALEMRRRYGDEIAPTLN